MTAEPIIDEQRRAGDFDAAVHGLRRSYEDWERECTRIVTDNELFNQLLDQGLRDLRALYTPSTAGGPRGGDPVVRDHVRPRRPDRGPPAADLTTRPGPRGAHVLANHQGWERDDWRDEEPGKILHESRQGELAAAGLIPHTPYYGSVDSTPWFLLLFAQYFRWTGDRRDGRGSTRRSTRRSTGSTATATWTATAWSSTAAFAGGAR